VSALPLASLVAAVRSSAIAPRVAAAEWTDAHLADLVRTASTAKGAVWLATRALPVAEPSETKQTGRWDTALRCLGLLADAGDRRALAMLSAYLAHVDTEISTD
jgi:hypothetical protein